MDSFVGTYMYLHAPRLLRTCRSPLSATYYWLHTCCSKTGTVFFSLRNESMKLCVCVCVCVCVSRRVFNIPVEEDPSFAAMFSVMAVLVSLPSVDPLLLVVAELKYPGNLQ